MAGQSRARKAFIVRMVSKALLACGGVALAVGGAAWAFGLRLNISGSIAPGVYRLSMAPPIRGSLVLVCLPAVTAGFARERGYLGRGSCTDGSSPVGKTVVALERDTVDVYATGISVNGHMLPNSRARDRDSRGRLLPRMQHGRYLVQDGVVWLLSTYSESSFDSRYFGAVPRKNIIASLRPVVQCR